MTDPLTAKELVEKSHEYIERLGRECAKTIFEEYRDSHRKFRQSTLANEVGSDVVAWFLKRDKNVHLIFESFDTNSQSAQSHLKFRGSTKDSNFHFSATVSAFIKSLSSDQDPIWFVRSVTTSANKSEFVKRN